MKNDIKGFYDATAQSTADEWYPNNLLLPTIADFISFLPEKPLVLDLGCGPGHESKRLSKAGAIVTGIDFSEKCIDIAKQRNPESDFMVGDIRSLNKDIGIFDGIFACASLIHIPINEFSLVLKSINSILKKSGCLNIIVLDGIGISEKYSNLEFEGKKYNRVVYLYSKDLIIDEAMQHGFSFVREGFLEEELKEYGWRNYIFQSN
jgi:SAM-dependent methyltransferase